MPRIIRILPDAGSQRGISLIVVMVMLLLGSILVLGSTRTNWLNESLVSNESDYQRAYVAAEALIADAETDIRGILPGGIPCNSSANFFGCRNRYGAGLPFIPESPVQDSEDLQAAIPNFATLPCRQGICLITAEDDLGANWWNDDLVDMTADTRTPNAIAATYGEFTGANVGTTGNPLLAADADGNYSGWYWIEVMEFNVLSGAMGPPPVGNLPVPTVDRPYVYRITALAQGRKPGTRVVLRSVFVPDVYDPEV
ncbi:pilus assembly protein PilX [Hydrogenophaga sp. D2P1]|uniref:Pilus assembly protein PilX n=1 Tax=Hydrogenophaga aromaticivorans TaxID=2610898 RepID=A0A7Y8GWT0_9BURK|nr:PilX N-terminal domain-containing pilus assembly protein [Hydrogenophaga aromaticivorans]NWF45453.1 pilus assembly protein PilX [Hydrogenophaga aromaticivorans]